MSSCGSSLTQARGLGQALTWGLQDQTPNFWLQGPFWNHLQPCIPPRSPILAGPERPQGRLLASHCLVSESHSCGLGKNVWTGIWEHILSWA